MTSRERLAAAARGAAVDRAPLVSFAANDEADALVVDASDVADALASQPERAVLALVLSPASRDVEQMPSLLGMMRDDPAIGQERLDELAAATRFDALQAFNRGADGICYRVDGADPAVCTPMQYGNCFLGADREILEEVLDARFNLLWVRGGEEAYLDLMLDLPAHALAWDTDATDVSPEQVRAKRQGALAGLFAGADVVFDARASGGEGRGMTAGTQFS